MPAPSHHAKGWVLDQINGRLAAVYGGTKIFDFDANDLAIAQAMTTVALVSASGGIIATTGSVEVSAALAAFIAPIGNAKLGNPGAFAGTQPQGAVIMGGTSLGGIAPVGTIATAAGVFASNTVVRKINAGGNVSDIGA